MVVCICEGLHFSTTSVSIYHKYLSDVRVKTFASRNLPESSLLNSECFDMLPNLFGYSVEKLWSFEFMMRFIFQLRASQYIMSFNMTYESKVMVVRICVDIPFQLSSGMIYYWP